MWTKLNLDLHFLPHIQANLKRNKDLNIWAWIIKILRQNATKKSFFKCTEVYDDIDVDTHTCLFNMYSFAWEGEMERETCVGLYTVAPIG